MGRVLTGDERIRLWSALSDAFIDNDVDYAAIARRLAGFDQATVKAAFFEEVAPVCYSNLQAPIPPIWTAFDSTWLAEAIDSAQEARRTSVLRRLRGRFLVAYLHHRLKDDWQCLERELERQGAVDLG